MTDKPIHYVRAWSGRAEDESPVCGADKWAPDVWGRRTQYVRYVTCDGCRELLRLPPPFEPEHFSGDEDRP